MIVESLLRSGWEVTSLSGFPAEIFRHVSLRVPDATPHLHAPAVPGLGRPPARAGALELLRRIPGGFALWTRIRTNPRLRRRHALARWRACRDALAALPNHPRLVFLPYLDDMLEPELSLSGVSLPVPWIGLHVSASDLREPALAPAMRVRLRVLREPGCRGLLVLDDKLPDLVRPETLGRIVATLPDIADTSVAVDFPLLQELRRRAAGRPIVSLLGHLSEAKNIRLFLQLAQETDPGRAFFLLAGQFEPLGVAPDLQCQIAAAAAGQRTNLWAIPDRIASEAEFNGLFRESAVIFAVYRNFTRSSNILSKAGFFRRPVMVADGHCMAERTAEYQLGLALAEPEPHAAGVALHRLLHDPPAADYARFDRDFSTAEFQRRLDDALTRAALL
ncbi:hypothetical protein [Oleiharenicola sp. Vm1]|uniref:hypothetical protein n=1 Tax=Oleiharenicola sp. Vm1 TaxID=3398393 RepID=UPI0039F473ED